MEIDNSPELLDRKLNNLCRICLMKLDDMINIHTESEQATQLVSMLTSLRNFEIIINDLLPQYICKQCAYELECSYNFQKKIQKNEEHFNNYIADPKSIDNLFKVDEELKEESNIENIVEPDITLIQIIKDEIKEEEITIDENDEHLEEAQNLIKIKTEESLQNSLASNSSDSILPEKSRAVYEKNYGIFQEWCKENKFSTINENVLLKYFEIQKPKYKATSLWSLFSQLKTCINNDYNIDVSEYKKLQAVLKQYSDGHFPKKSKILKEHEINKFIKEADDRQYLAMKIIPDRRESDIPQIEPYKPGIKLFPSKIVERVFDRVNNTTNDTTCIKCNFNFSRAVQLIEHMRQVHTESQDYWCSSCNLEVENLSEHLLLHKKDKLSCEFCRKPFLSKDRLCYHLSYHCVERSHTCEICNRPFALFHSYKRHLQNHDQAEIDEFERRKANQSSGGSTQEQSNKLYAVRFPRPKCGCKVTGCSKRNCECVKFKRDCYNRCKCVGCNNNKPVMRRKPILNIE